MEIELTHDKKAIIDEEDNERVLKYNWHWRKSDGYVGTSVTVKGPHYIYKDGIKKKSPQKTLLLHHFILGIKGREDLKGKVVDHINGDKLDNRKENLRLISVHRNLQNRTRLNSNNTLGRPNVQFNKKLNKYRYRIQYNNVHYYSSYEYFDVESCYNAFLKFKEEKGFK